MKHKKYNECLPYTYFIRRKSDGLKYHGVRWANSTGKQIPKTSPLNDLGVSYFSTGKLKEDFKNNPENYEFKIKWTFDSIAEAQDYESKVNKKLVYKTDWANAMYGKTRVPSDKAFNEGQIKRIKKMTGRTKETHPGVRAQSEKLKGRPLSETHKANLRKPKPKRTKEHCDNLSKSKTEAYCNGSIKKLTGELNPMFGKEPANKGKSVYYHKDTLKQVYLFDHETNSDYVKGSPPNVKKDNAKGRKWYHNPKTGKSKMFIPGTELDGFILGRK